MSLRHIAPLSRTSVHYLQRWATYCTVCTKRVLAFLSLSIAQPSQRHCKNVNWNIGQVRVLPLRLRVCFRDVAPGDRPQAPPLAKHVAAVSCEPVHCGTSAHTYRTDSQRRRLHFDVDCPSFPRSPLPALSCRPSPFCDLLHATTHLFLA
jgi:hypothetical protein